MNTNIDFDSLFKDLDSSAITLNESGTSKYFGFTDEQVRFINVLIENAIKQYHKQLFTE